MNNNENYQEIFGHFGSKCDKMDALYKQYAECIQALGESCDVFMLVRTFGDLKALLKRAELEISRGMDILDRAMDGVGVSTEQHERSSSPQILTQEEIEALLK